MFYLNMKVAFFLFLLQISSSEINNGVVKRFIRSSNKTISIATIDNAENNLQYIVHQFPGVPRAVLRFTNRTWIENCTSYANAELHDEDLSVRRKSIKILSGVEKHDFIVFTTLRAMEAALKCIVHPTTRFLIIVTDVSTKSPSITERNLTEMLNKTWTHNGALKVFISTHNTIHTYNPFYRNGDGSFGKLNSFVDYTFEGDGGRDMRQLNGYPMRLEMFTSSFTISRIKSPKSIQDFYGPDVNVAKTTENFLNATCEFYFVKLNLGNETLGFKFKSKYLTP